MKKIRQFGLLMFAATLFACGGGGGGTGGSGSGVSGTAAVGSPIEGADVLLKCASGAVYSSTTAKGGRWKADLQETDYPCALRVADGKINGKENSLALHSLVQQPGTANITTLTDLLIAALTNQTPDQWFEGIRAESLKSQITPAAIQKARETLQTRLATLPGAPSLPGDYDPVTTDFVADPSDENDALLEAYGKALKTAGTSHEAAVESAASAQSLTTAATTTGPQKRIPAKLWSPVSGVTPASGNYIYLQSDAGDYIGAGKTYTYTNASANIIVNASGGYLSMRVNGDERWTFDFQTMSGLSKIEHGYYKNLQRYPFHDAAVGGLDWSGEGRGCNQLKGWVAVDDVGYKNGQLRSITLRFEQHCEGRVPALHGKIVWKANDTTAPAGPVTPVPSELWSPAPGTTPASGNYVYLQSDAGDYIGAGRTYTYTNAAAMLKVTPNGNRVSVNVQGDQDWSGDFQAMDTLSQLQPGYYGNLERYPFHNPVRGGLSWSGEGRGCNTLTGWFAVDQITYTAGALTSIDLRFEQHCEGNGPAVRGKIHWSASDTFVPGGPVLPVPENLWTPPQGTTPSAGNYVYLQSDAGDYIGGGKNYLYTSANGGMTVRSNANALNVATGGWYGDFVGMNTITQLKPGYYGDLQRYPFHNPAKGGLSWSGNGRGCNTLKGWFVVDDVTYVNGFLTAIELRFEQHCEGGTPALRGKIRWVQ